MSHGSVVFDGLEIDRVIDFVTLIYPRPGDRHSRPDADILGARCEARATLLVGEASKAPVVHKLNGPPFDIGDPGYKRTLLFHDDNGRIVEFGGVNAIREEWRLERITFRFSSDEPPVSVAQVQTWLDTLFPRPGSGIPRPGSGTPTEAQFESELGRLRLVLMGVIPCDGLDGVREIVRGQLSAILGDPPRAKGQWVPEGIGALLGDLEDPQLVQDNWDSLRANGALEGRYLSGLLRQLCRQQPLRERTALERFISERLAAALNRLSRDPQRVSADGSSLEDALTECWVILEAMSFASSISPRLHADMVRAIRMLGTLHGQLSRMDLDPVGSALCGAVLAYAKLFRTSQGSGEFANTVRAVQAIIRSMIEKQGGRQEDVTLRIAAMAALAQTTTRTDNDVQQGFSAVASIFRAAPHRRAPQVEMEAELAAGADAMGYLFSLRSAQDVSDAERDAAKVVADCWQSTPSPIVRRACARNILEAVWQAVPLDALLQGSDRLATRLGRIRRGAGVTLGLDQRAGSIRAARLSRKPFAIDLPSQVLLMALDDWPLLTRLQPSPDYVAKTPSAALSAALRAFSDSQQLYFDGNLPGAIAGFHQAADAIRSLPSDFIDLRLTEHLADGIVLRATCCELNLRNGAPWSQTVPSARDQAQRLHQAAKALAPSNPDVRLAASFDHLLSGTAGSEFWQGGSRWSEATLTEFERAIDLGSRAGSKAMRRFCDRHVRPLTPRRVLSTLFEVSGDAGKLPVWEFLVGAINTLPILIELAAQAVIGLIDRGVKISDQTKRNRRVEQMLAALRRYRLRPVGIVGIGQALQW